MYVWAYCMIIWAYEREEPLLALYDMICSVGISISTGISIAIEAHTHMIGRLNLYISIRL